MKNNIFKAKLYKTFLLAALVPVLLIFLLLVIDNKNYVNRHINETIKNELNVEIDVLNKWIDFKIDELNRSSALIKEQIRNENFTGELKGTLNFIVNKDRDIINAYLTNTHGYSILSGINIPRVDGRSRSWYIEAEKNDMNISSPYVDSITGKRVITFSKAIRDEDGNLLGVLGMDCLFEDIINKYEKLFLKVDGKIAIIDSTKSMVYKNIDIDDEILKNYERDYLESELIRVNSTGYIFARRIEKFDSRIIFYIDKKDYISTILLVNINLIIKLVAGCIGIIGLMVYFARYISEPIDNFENTIRKYRRKINDKENFENEGATYRGSRNLSYLYDEVKDEELVKLLDLFVKYEEFLIAHGKDNEKLDLESSKLASKNEKILDQIKVYRDKCLRQRDILSIFEAKYRELVSNNMDMIFLTDRFGVISFVSDLFEEKLNYDSGELIGRNISEIIDEISNDRNLFKIFLKRDFENIDLVLNSKNLENKISVSCSIQRIFEDSKVHMLQGICRDVSREKKMYYEYFNRNRELFIVNEISRVMTNNTTLDNILEDIVEKINMLFDISLCTIRILEGDELVLKAYSGTNTRLKFLQSPGLDNSHMGYALKNRQILTIKDKRDMLFSDVSLEDTLKTLKNIVYMPLYSKDESLGVLAIGSDSEIISEKLNILSYLSDSASVAIEKTMLFDKLSKNYYKTITSLGNAVEEKLGIIKGHTLRVSKYSVLIAKSMYLKGSEINEIEIAGLLHDIGKIGIKDSILRSAYTDKEAREEVLNNHTVIGREMLEPIGISKDILDGIYLHHKNYDLSGYPKDVSLNEIPLIARIIAVANSFDNLMNSLRGSDEENINIAFEIIKNESASKYCPEVVNIFEGILRDLKSEIIKISKESYYI